MAMLTSEEWSAIHLSITVGAYSTLVCMLPGIFFGWLLARKQFYGKSVLDAVIHLPLVIPPVAVGYLLLLVLGRHGVLGRWLDAIGLQIAFNWRGAVLASAVMAFPLMVRAIRLAIELVDPLLEGAAGNLGASPRQVFWTVTLPLAWPGILTGMILAFARSIGEFGATITFAGNIAGMTRTLPLAMFTYTQIPGGDAQAVRLIVLSMLVSFAALMASEWLSRRAVRRLRGR